MLDVDLTPQIGYSDETRTQKNKTYRINQPTKKKQRNKTGGTTDKYK